jgi:opacity protein-like surface antigen
MRRFAFSALLALALAACATAPTVYGPAASAEAAGYRQTKIEADRYRVSFRANPDLKAPQVEDMALRRAAELTLQDGYQWFRVVTRNTELVGGRPAGGTSVGVGGSTGSFGSGVGVGIGFDLSPDSRRYETTMEILMGRGARPEGADAYDAQTILSRTPG